MKQYLKLPTIITLLLTSIALSAGRALPAEEAKQRDARSGEALVARTAIHEDSARVRVLLVAHEEATISSRFFATIKEIHVKESDRFKAGQPLVSFNCAELRAALEVARAEVRLQRTTSQANAQLHAEKILGTLEKDLSRIKVEEAVAKQAEIETRIDQCRIEAPFSGQVVELKAKNHETMQPGNPIMLIHNPANMEMHVYVPSKWLEWLQPGATFQAHIEETGKTYAAVVHSVGAKVDEVSRTIKIYAKLAQPDAALLPGMSGYAEFSRNDSKR